MTHEPEDLTRLLREAVDDVEPRSGIQAIRSRTSTTKEYTMTPFRTWFLGALGAAAATAAVITAVAVVGNDDPTSSENPPAGSGSSTASTEPTPTEDTSPSETPSQTPPVTSTVALPVYYVGATDKAGPRLFREFQRLEAVDSVDGRLTAAVCAAASGTPLDRDYTTYWKDILRDPCQATWNGDVVTISLNGALGALHDGTSMTEAQRKVSLQQLIYTAQAALGQGRVPVQFLLAGNHTDQMLGQPASNPLAGDPVLEVNNHVQLSTPNEGDVISGDSLEVTGVANGFEGNVVVRLQRYEGTGIVFEEPTIAGTYEDKLFPFSVTIDLSAVPAGTYIVMAMTEDSSGGAEGSLGSFTDTRVVTIE